MAVTWKTGIRLGQRVVAGVVAERPFLAQRLARVNVAFDDEVGVGRHFQVVGLALDQLDGFLAQVTGEEEFIQAIGQRRGGAKVNTGSPPRKTATGMRVPVS